MKDANVKLKINGDAAGFVRSAETAKSAAASSAAAIAAAYNSTAAAVKAVSAALGGFRAALGSFNAVVAIANNLWSVIEKVRGAISGATEATDEFAEAAKRVTEAGVSSSLFSALKDQADAAGVAADEFSEKLKQFKEHKITFDQLAAAIGTTATALHGAAAGRGGEMAELIAGYHESDARAVEGDARRKQEGEAVRRLVRDIYRAGDDFGNGNAAAGLWDRLLGIAGGDAGKAGELFNENKSWWMTRSVGVGMYGDEALRNASGRYAARQAEREAAARAETEAADKEAARLAAEEKAKADKAAAEEKARADEKARREKEAADEKARKEREAAEAAEAKRQSDYDAAFTGRVRTEMLKQREIESVRVSAPSAASSPGAYGALFGADPSALNRERMDRERNDRLRAIDEKYAETLRKFDETLEILKGG